MIPPISVQAGEGHREIVQVVATDNDLGQNAVITYSIYHVSNNGRNKFKIDPASGTIETTGKLNAGEQYSITVQVSHTTKGFQIFAPCTENVVSLVLHIFDADEQMFQNNFISVKFENNNNRPHIH